MIFGCPGSDKFKQPKPEICTCPFCGGEVEIWSDEFRAECPKCKKVISKDGTQSCLDWCKEGKACVGDEVYRKYMERKNMK